MKKTIFFLSLLALLFTTGCQKSYDDVIDELKKKQQSQTSEIDNLRKELQSIYVMVNSGNQDIATLKGLVDALQKQKSVVSYKAVNDGYELSMSDGTVITLKNGAKGADGHSPAVNVKKDGDNYFWIIDGIWLTDADGKKIPASAGIAPQLRVNAANQWEVSVNNGSTWNIVRDTSGNPVLATGPKGSDGDANLVISEADDTITVVYKGSTYVMPKKVYSMTFTTTRDKVYILIDADIEDRDNIWVDWNNNGKRDPEDVIKTFDKSVYYTIDAKTVTVYGKVLKFECDENSITALDVTNNSALIDLFCADNQITSLDVSNNPNLKYLYTSGNKLSELNLDKNPELLELDCGYNQLTTLNIENNTKLEKLYCLDNKFRSMKFSNTELKELHCAHNPLDILDVSHHEKLTVLNCPGGNLKSIDLKNNKQLKRLDCALNELTILDLSNNKELEYLECDENQLTNLDISNNKKINNLVCSNNKLVSLNVANGNNKNFTRFYSLYNPNLTCIQVDRDFNPDPAIWKKDDTATWNNSGNPCP